jgi:hypothetical protein
MIRVAITLLNTLFNGQIPDKLDTKEITDESQRELAQQLNKLVSFMEEIHGFIVPLSKGEINDIRMNPKNFFASPFKELHSRLLHLTWQAKQVANGDYSQRVDFMGDFSEAFNAMIVSLDLNRKLLKRQIDELESALSHIKHLEGILPICSFCKKIRIEASDPQNQKNWVQFEKYISSRTEARFSHSICPDCMKKNYPEILD